MEIPDFLTPLEVEALYGLMCARNPKRRYQQHFTEFPQAVETIQTALVRAGLEYEIVSPLVTLSWHNSGKTIGRHQDTRVKDCTHKLAVCIRAPTSGGATVFYPSLHGAETSRTYHAPGKALLFDIKAWHSGEKDAVGEKLLLGFKLRALVE